jgi:hypothetical protein
MNKITASTVRRRVRTVEDSVNSDIHPITEARYSLTHAMRGPQTLRSRHPTFLMR